MDKLSLEPSGSVDSKLLASSSQDKDMHVVKESVNTESSQPTSPTYREMLEVIAHATRRFLVSVGP